MRSCLLPDGRQLEFYITRASIESQTPEYVLLLHGMTESSVIFADKHSARFHYICLDRPGYGGSSAPPATYTYEYFAQDVLCLLDHLKIPKIRAVVGHSSGGPCALAVYSFLPTTRCGQCILLASDVEYSSCPQFKDPLDAPLLDVNPHAENPAEFGFSTARELHELDLTLYRESIRRNAHQNNAGVIHDYYCERKPWNIPASKNYVQVVVGSLDPYISVDHALWFIDHAKRASVVHQFDGYGHFDIVLCSKAWQRIEALM